jgi:hypothetical protein
MSDIRDVDEFVLIDLEAQYYAVSAYLKRKQWNEEQIKTWMTRYGSVYGPDEKYDYFVFMSLWGFRALFKFENISAVRLMAYRC